MKHTMVIDYREWLAATPEKRIEWHAKGFILGRGAEIAEWRDAFNNHGANITDDTCMRLYDEKHGKQYYSERRL